MLKKQLFFLLCLVALIGKAQEAKVRKLAKDTVALQEVLVSVRLPLNNNDLLNFYRTNQFSTLDNITARLDGMSLIKRGAYALEPMVNGFSGGQLNVTIDGMRMFGACTDKMDPITSYIEPTNLKSITIKQGTGSCSSGCNIGGAVDMSLVDPIMDSSSTKIASIATGYESVSNAKNLLFNIGSGTNHWKWLLNGVYRKYDNYRDGNNWIVPFSQFEKLNIHSSVKYLLNANNHIKTDLLYDLANNVGYPALPMDVSKAQATLIAMEYLHQSHYQLKAKVYYNDVLHIMDDSKRDSLYQLKNKPIGKSDSVYMRMDMPGRSSTVGTYVQLQLPWNNNNLTLKADNYTNQSIAEMTMYMRYAGMARETPMYMQTWPEMLRNVTGLYAENSTYISSQWTLTANARVDYNIDKLLSEYGQLQFSVFNYTLPTMQSKMVKSANITAVYRISNNASITASTGYAERMPTIGERMGYYLYNAYDGYDYIGNPYLKAEKSNFFRANFQYGGARFKINLNQSLSFIQDYIMGLTNHDIQAMNFYAKGLRVYSNVAHARLFSTDIQLLYSPSKEWNAFVLTKFTMGQISNNQPMPLIPPLKNIVALQYKKSNFNLQVESEWAMAQHRINTQYGEQQTPAYIIFNAKSGYQFRFQKMTFDTGLSITNIFNSAYYEHLDWGRIYRPGRSVDLYLKVAI